jgi:hypothetical protein
MVNSTWRSYQVVPAVAFRHIANFGLPIISNDHEMDLFLYRYGRDVSWVSNVRGASATLHLNNIT